MKIYEMLLLVVKAKSVIIKCIILCYMNFFKLFHETNLTLVLATYFTIIHKLITLDSLLKAVACSWSRSCPESMTALSVTVIYPRPSLVLISGSTVHLRFPDTHCNPFAIVRIQDRGALENSPLDRPRIFNASPRISIIGFPMYGLARRQWVFRWMEGSNYAGRN